MYDIFIFIIIFDNNVKTVFTITVTYTFSGKIYSLILKITEILCYLIFTHFFMTVNKIYSEKT